MIRASARRRRGNRRDLRRLHRWPAPSSSTRRAPRASATSCSPLPLTPDLGGATSRVIATDKAYTFLATNAPDDAQRATSSSATASSTPTGRNIPASVKIFDGLGPTFNRNSCSGCHVRDGRGRPPETAGAPMESMLVRLSASAPAASRCRTPPMASSSTTAPSSACRPRAAPSST